MNEIRKLPEKCSLCGGPDIVYAEVSMAIKYRDDSSHVYTSNLKLCVECADRFAVGRRSETVPPSEDRSPAPVTPIRPHGGAHTTCTLCDNPAVVLTSCGPKCSAHAFKY